MGERSYNNMRYATEGEEAMPRHMAEQHTSAGKVVACQEAGVRVVCSYGGVAWLSPWDAREMRNVLAVMLACAVESGVPAPPSAVELLLVDDARIAQSNWRYMGCAGPTNILSFPGGAGGSASLLLSLDTARRECLLYGQELCAYVRRLLAHGMGHVCGLEHGATMDRLCARLEQAAARGT